MSADALHLYLNDHLAGSTTGRDLARSLADHFAETDRGPEMARIADETAEDREALERIMEELGAQQSPVKQALGWIAERVGRPAMTGGGIGHPELGELRAFEMLSLGVEGKSCLWETLQHLSPTEPALADEDFARLLERAHDQREVLERERLAAAGRVGATR